MGSCNITSDGQAKPGTGFVLVSSLIKPDKWPEYIFAVLGRNARPIIINDYGQPASLVCCCQGNGISMAESI